MDNVTLIFIGIGLAMDCFAVAISKGISVKKFYLSSTLFMAFLFGLFQAGMPLIGKSFVSFISKSDHWIAFGLLTLIGGKMLYEGLKNYQPTNNGEFNPFHWLKILTLAIATSIDALATGIIFVPYPEVIWKAIFIIGFISFLFVIAGMFIGVRFGKRFHIKVEALGGIILVALGIKILIEHTCA
jgi:putative Mn2+ efflux pump MntP